MVMYVRRVKMKKTKIVCTIGPSTDDENIMRELMKNGMDVARFNFSHSDHSVHKARFETVCKLREELGVNIATLLDTKGPEVRLKNFKDHKPVTIKDGDTFTLTTREVEGDETICSITFPQLPKDVSVGTRILINDGNIELKATRVDNTDIVCEVIHGGVVSDHKGINVPDVNLSMPYISDADMADLEFGAKMGFDYIAASFVRTGADVIYLRKFTQSLGWFNPRIIAKIENQEGVDNIDEILEVADGVMVARGDLGIEVPQERIPGIQRVLIRKCILAKKPVIVATQMLHTMINNPRPTRAEVTDIANAIYYRTDALMLSGETAYGKYPVEAVKTMAKIAAQAEKDKLEENDIRIPLDENSNDVTAFLAKQAVKATSKLKIRAIITDSYSGRTARNLAAFRGKYPVLAICYKEKTMRHLALSYGVEAIYMPELANGQEYYFAALRRLLKEGRLQPSDMVGYLSSGKEGTQTSFLEINVVEDALKHAEETVLPNNNRYL